MRPAGGNEKGKGGGAEQQFKHGFHVLLLELWSAGTARLVSFVSL
jgi:hypothetical protein